MYSVRDYFDEIAEKFDGYYKSKSSNALTNIFHNLLRKPGLERRFKHTVGIVGECRGKKILDVGCGSGIYGLFFAKAGAEVTGIDFARNMINLANRELANIKGVNCSFICKDFLEYEAEDCFDYSLAIGVFDYINMDNAVLYLAKLKDVSTKIIATFPRRYTFQTPLRKLYLCKKVKAYFYTKAQITKLCDVSHLKCKFHNSGPIWTVEMYR